MTTVIEMHPEELFDKLSHGALSQQESARLRAHLGSCSVCRFELDARGAFDDEFRSRLIPAEPRCAGPVPRRAGSRLRRAVIWAFAAAGIFVATGALAAVVTGKLPWELVTNAATPATHGSDGATTATPKRKSAAAAVSDTLSLAPTAGASSALAPSSEIASALSGAAPLADEPRAARATARPGMLERGSKPQPTAQVSASALFADANRARTNGEAGQAIQLYRNLQRQFPSSREAELSQLTLARLLLDSGDARSALGGFDAYLGRGGRTLQAEALVGRALSLRALGRREAEISAWREVIARHPRSVYARQASERLSALGQL